MCKQILTLTKSYGHFLVLVLALGFASLASAQEHDFVVNPLTGVAMSGYDPVSYFTEPEPLRGSPEYVHEWAGVPWYFATAANRDVFARAPETYAPLFSGHCAMAMARGYRSQGNPAIYRIVADRLVLFYSVGNREAFSLNMPSAMGAAMASFDQLPAARGQDRIALPETDPASEAP